MIEGRETTREGMWEAKSVPEKQGCPGWSQEGGISRVICQFQAGVWLSGWGLAL